MQDREDVKGKMNVCFTKAGDFNIIINSSEPTKEDCFYGISR